AGADQPDGIRQVATPRPPVPPTMKAPLRTSGKTTTHWLLANKSLGIPLSGVPMISLKTLAPLLACLAPSFVFGPRIGGSTGAAGAVVAALVLVFVLLPCAKTLPTTASIKIQSKMVHRILIPLRMMHFPSLMVSTQPDRRQAKLGVHSLSYGGG